jgi:hypothetical protein
MSEELKAFAAALIRHWASKTFLFLSGFSTIATYMPTYVSGFTVPRWLPAVFLVIGVLVGAFDLYREQARKIEELAVDNQRLRQVKSDLHPEIHEGSQFLRHIQDRQEVGLYIHLMASIENRGARPAVISRFSLDIAETGTAGDFRPRGFSGIQGPKFYWAIDSQKQNIAASGFVQVGAHNLAGPGPLPFYIPLVAPSDCRLLHCKLTVYDSRGESGSVSFELGEYSA